MTDANYDQSLPPLEPGTVLKGGRHDDYEILELTSNKGGFGRIYRARSLKVSRGGPYEREVAIKEFHLLHTGATGLGTVYSWTMMDLEERYRDMRMKFVQEAAILRKLYGMLRDKHIPSVLDAVWEENGRMFYAMNFIEGQTLREMMRGEMAEYRAVGYIIQIAKVLHKAHELGLVHADVSPNNIMHKRTPRNFTVLVDWGNANAMNYDDGYGIGTDGYRAPETFRGKPQADVYSLAATLLYLLTDRKPLMLNSEEGIAEVRQRLAEHNVSSETTEAILHAMNIDVDKATTSILEFVSELPKDVVIKILLNYTDNDS